MFVETFLVNRLMSLETMDIERIPPEEIDAFNPSAVDPAGIVFRWRGGIYRALRAESAAFYGSLFRDGIIRGLIERGLLVESELAPLALEGFDSVVRHRKIDFVSYPYEWCAPMIRDAAKSVLDLVAALQELGLTLKDGHLFNTLFDNCRPHHVDLTSIVPAGSQKVWPAAPEFRGRCLYPLLLMEAGEDRLARLLIYEEIAVTRADVFRMREASSNSLRQLTTDFGAAFWHRLRESLRERLGRPLPLRAELGDSPLTEAPLPISKDALPMTGSTVRRLLEKLRPRTVLDVGCKFGAFSEMAAETGARVVAFDKDPARVARLYRKGPRALPLVMDFCRTTPSSGPLDFWSASAATRFRCELVLAMELLPTIISRDGMHFREVAAGLAAFSTRWALVRFHRTSLPLPAWYRPEILLEHLRKEFRSVESWPEDPEDGSLLFLCEK